MSHPTYDRDAPTTQAHRDATGTTKFGPFCAILRSPNSALDPLEATRKAHEGIHFLPFSQATLLLDKLWGVLGASSLPAAAGKVYGTVSCTRNLLPARAIHILESLEPNIRTRPTLPEIPQ